MYKLFTCSVIALLYFFYPYIASAASFQERINGMAEIKSVRVHSNAEKVRIVVDAAQEVEYDTVVLSNPQRVVVNIKGAWLSPDVMRNQSIDSSFANKVRVSQFDKTTVRVVVETAVGKNDYTIFPLAGGDAAYRVVMDFGRGSPPATADPVLPVPQPVSTDPPAPVQQEPVYTSPGIAGKTITIDPGHGGSDSGAIGPTGVTEKSITLRIGMELRQLLTDAGARVVMTRSTDVDVAPQPSTDVSELQARCDVANATRADAFVSIHMDSFTSPSAKGTTGYYYSKGSAAAKRLADSVKNGVLAQLGTDDRGTKSCNFYLVKNTTMPATLVEVAFVSNKDEEKMLNATAGIKKAAQGIFDGIVQYFMST